VVGLRLAAATATDRDRIDATARSVIECAADPIIAFGTDRAVLIWNPAAERMFGWAASEIVGLEPPIIPEELRAEHNAVLERVRSGGQISFATRRMCKDGSVLAMDTIAKTFRYLDEEEVAKQKKAAAAAKSPAKAAAAKK